MKKYLHIILLLLFFTACTQTPQPVVEGHDWSNDVIYEMNIRQYTPEGTFAAAQQQLPRLREMGVDIIWLMPIHPIGVKDRKGTLGSYYAISDYCAVNPEFGTLADFDAFLEEAHRLGFKLMLDWVANHTSPDALWMTGHPDWYLRDSLGKPIVKYDWTDIASLDYGKKEVWAAQDQAMRFWMERGIDGFRCDAASEMPLDFWKEIITGLRRDYPGIFMLAEGENPDLHTVSGFDATYAWELHHLMNSIAKGEKQAVDLAEYLNRDSRRYPGDAYRMMFTSNHDENSWAGTEFERMGEAARVMAVLTFTLPNSFPLIYTGQEIGLDRRFKFFEKDPIQSWPESDFTTFYKELTALHHNTPALAAGAGNGSFEILSTDNNTLVFSRSVPGNKVVVSAQLTAPWEYSIKVEEPEKAAGMRVEPLSWWTGMKTPLQLMIYAPGISRYDVSLEGGKGVSVTKVVKGDSNNYLFADVEISEDAVPGTYELVFTKGQDSFRYPYEIAARKEGSAVRKSFTTSDMIYLIMPDRFANGDPANDNTPDTDDKAARDEFHGRHGGDIQGIIDHLDYISELGATAVWTTPMLKDNAPEGSYHGYAASDYYHIDPRFGDNAMYKEFVDKSHEKGLKVIMDIVTNHCGTEHWWFNDTPFLDWIHRFPEYTGTNVCFSANMDPNASKKDLYYQESGWFVPSMPDMNLDNPFVLQYFKQWAVWWIEYAGLDGFRVDTYPYNEKVPMSQWCAAINEEYPDFNIVGECWTTSIPQLAYWQKDNPNKDGFNSHLPAIMDFPLHDAIRIGMTEKPEWGKGMIRIYDVLSHDFVYQDLSNMMIFIGNHDTERAGDVLGQDPERMKLAMTLMATMRGIPQIFAGDEQMFVSKDMSQGHGGLRVDFPGGWPGDPHDRFTDEGRRNADVNTDGKKMEKGQAAELYDYVSRLFQWRKNKEVIHHGKTMHFLSRDNTYGFFRYNDQEKVFVFINNTDETKCIPWSYYSEMTGELTLGRDVLTGKKISMSDSTTVGPKKAMVIEF